MGKSKGKIINWPKYRNALVQRGSLTFSVDEQAVQSWHCTERYGGRERGFQFSNAAIETALMVKGIFNLPLRALQGFLDSIFHLMDVPLKSPTYSRISKRVKTADIKYRRPNRGPVAHVVIDATGLKVYGEGEWKMRKHGKEKRRVWCKLHFAVDTQTHKIIAAEVSLENVADNEVLPPLINPLQRSTRQISADGANDTKVCHKLLQRKGCKPTIPPRSNAVFWEDGHPRNDAVEALRNDELPQWKRDKGYHLRSLAETAMYRFKQLIGSRLSLRDYDA